MGGKAQSETVGGLDPRPGQGQPIARLPGKARQVPAAADIGKEANAGLGHGKGGALCGHAIAGGKGNPDAAAHHHPVHQGHDGLGIGHQKVVELIFQMEKGPRLRSIACAAFGQHSNVAARTKAARAGMVQQHHLHGLILAPAQQGVGHDLAHAQRQGVQRLGPVQGQAPDAPFKADQNRIGHGRNSSRAMITRMTSLVPSRIWWTRRSRTIRSSG